MILLFTDYGAADIYVGQPKAVLAQRAPGIPVIDLLHEAPPFDVSSGAHLLSALTTRLRAGPAVLAVVDPGVGGERDAIAACADGCWVVAPDNGLAAVLAARANRLAAGRPVRLVPWARLVRAGSGDARARRPDRCPARTEKRLSAALREPFWYENSIGLAELAARSLGLAIGQRVSSDG